jgi:glycopeptide antibiotics resistance protein
VPLPDFKLRHVFAVLFLTATSVFATWVVVGPWFPKTVLAQVLVGSFFVCGPLGAFWMLSDCIRERKTPFVYFLLAFIPFGFIFYYLERVRPRAATTVSKNPQGPD